jgi:ABC-type Na+ transport system ATPase subunit NatA
MHIYDVRQRQKLVELSVLTSMKCYGNEITQRNAIYDQCAIQGLSRENCEKRVDEALTPIDCVAEGNKVWRGYSERRVRNLEVAAALVPIPIAWLLVYMSIGIIGSWRWVKRGWRWVKH